VEKDTRDNPFYEELVEQVNSRRCVAFVGSGLSMGYYPSWSDLIGGLCEACGLLNEAYAVVSFGSLYSRNFSSSEFAHQVGYPLINDDRRSPR
jgi:hypothetical protein